ncbi:MAG: metalloregulator ArsR/SmtB family transcription factor [bacterium]
MLKEADLKKIFNDKKEIFLTTSFKALGDINRHRIFQLLSVRSRMSAGDIAKTLKISRPLASQHLKILEQAKLFTKEKIGQNKFYRVNKENIFAKILIGIILKNIA